jgi:DNA-binding transcriptional regulator YiaG
MEKDIPMATSKKKVGTERTTVSRNKLVPLPQVSVNSVRGRLGLSRKLFSRLAGFSERAIADWESGKPVSEAALRRVKELDRLRERLSGVVKEEAIPQWLNSPNDAFEGLKPLEVIERGEVDRLWTMIYHLESGVAS